MRTTVLLTTALLATSTSASWFSSSEPEEYLNWSQAELTKWLKEHNINVPKGYSKEQAEALVKENWYAGQKWTDAQIDAAKAQYANVKDTTLDSWNESQLREFLVNQGVVAPSGPREQLVLAARKQYWAYQSATSAAAAAASTAVYGDKAAQASKTAASASRSATSAATSASASVSAIAADVYSSANAKLDDSKDYIYSTWTDSEIKKYLQDKGVIQTQAQATRAELLARMRENYAAVSDPVWKAWSDSYLYNWLHERGLVRTEYEKKRDRLVEAAERYYYDAKDTAYSSWDESELKDWLIAHGIVKSDAQLTKEKLQKLVADNYSTAVDTVYGGWKDSDVRDWLIANGYLRSDAQVKRDELLKLFHDKYTDVASQTSSYLTWPDARLRAFLRSHGVEDRYLPATRPGLLQEVRVRWVQSSNAVESLLQKIRDVIGNQVEYAEDQLSSLLATLTGTVDAKSYEAKKAAYGAAEEKAAQAASSASSLSKAAKSAKNEL